MTNIAATISVPANSTIGLFAALEIDPLHCMVTVHSNEPGDGGQVRLSDGAGENLALALPWDYEGQVIQFITDKDEVYFNSNSSSAVNVFVYLSAAA